jgi:hypothetical protein
MKTRVECVANFSEGCELTDAIISGPASAEESDTSLPSHIGQE